jgi:hypothetical protein
MLVPDNCTPSYEGSDPFINSVKGVRIFLKGSEKSVVTFGRIFSLVREEFDDDALFDFRVHRTINVFQSPSWGDASYPDPKMWELSGEAEPTI